MPDSTCVFCEALAGNIPASFVLRDRQASAFVDLRQTNAGHTLVVPNDHVPDILALQSDAGTALMQAVVRVAKAVNEAFAPEGISIWQSNGEGADQEVPHVHFHVMPRFRGDGLLRIYSEKPDTPPKHELDRLAARIRSVLQSP